MAATLDNVVNRLKESSTQNQEGLKNVESAVESMNSNIKGLIRLMEMNRLDNLEDKREKKRAKDSASGAMGKNNKAGMMVLPGLMSLQGLAAGLAAVAGAVAGLRGWEAKALANIDKIGKGLGKLFGVNVAKAIDQKFINVRARILRNFGLDPTLGKVDPETGKRALKVSVLDQIGARIDKFRISALKMFGLGADGKPIVVQGADGRFKVPVAAKITTAIQDLISPVVKLADGIGGYIKGAGAPLFGFLKTIGIVGGAGAAAAGGVVAGVARLAGKILLPLGILFSAKEAFDAWQSTDGSFTEKFTAASFAFLGDFIGAPLDLLKSGIVYLYRNALGLEVDDEGKITGEGFAAAVGRALQGFSFEESIKAIPELFNKIFDAIKAFFNDPIGVGAQVVGNLYEAIKGAFLGVIKAIVRSIPGGESIFPSLFATTVDGDLANAEQRQADAFSSIRRSQIQMRDASMILSGNTNRRDAALADIAELENRLATGDYGGFFGASKEQLERRLGQKRNALMNAEQAISSAQQQLAGARFAGGAAAAEQARIAAEIERLKAEQERQRAGGAPIIMDNSSTNNGGGTTIVTPTTPAVDVTDPYEFAG